MSGATLLAVVSAIALAQLLQGVRHTRRDLHKHNIIAGVIGCIVIAICTPIALYLFLLALSQLL